MELVWAGISDKLLAKFEFHGLVSGTRSFHNADVGLKWIEDALLKFGEELVAKVQQVWQVWQVGQVGQVQHVRMWTRCDTIVTHLVRGGTMSPRSSPLPPLSDRPLSLTGSGWLASDPPLASQVMATTRYMSLLSIYYLLLTTHYFYYLWPVLL